MKTPICQHCRKQGAKAFYSCIQVCTTCYTTLKKRANLRRIEERKLEMLKGGLTLNK